MNRDQHQARNEQCSCESGKKYKNCHFIRIHEEPLRDGDVRKAHKKALYVGRCQHPEASRSTCGKPIKAHSIQERVLKNIADDGAVLRFMRRIGDPPTKSSSAASQPPFIQPVKRASTDMVFCIAHDCSLFASLENRAFIPNREQLFLLAFRSVAHEYFKLSVLRETEGLMFNLDRGRSRQDQGFIQDIAKLHEARNARAFQEVSALKASYDKAWSAEEWGRVNSIVLEVDQQLPIASAALIVPEFGFDGSFLQHSILGLPTEKYFSFALLPVNKKSYAVWSWIGNAALPNRFFDGLQAIPPGDIGNALFRFAFEYSENTYTNPDWWSKRPERLKKALLKRMKPDPLHNRLANCLADDRLDYLRIGPLEHSYKQL